MITFMWKWKREFYAAHLDAFKGAYQKLNEILSVRRREHVLKN